MNKAKLRELIATEKAFRVPHSRYYKLWSERIELLQTFGDMGKAVVLTNADGVPGKTCTLFDSCAACGFTCIEHVATFLQGCKHTIKLSRQKERFLRFVHNHDKAEATRMHLKINKTTEDMMTAYGMDPSHHNARVFDALTAETVLDCGANEQGYLQICNVFKEQYEYRASILDCL
jgi:hypothetical protein